MKLLLLYVFAACLGALIGNQTGAMHVAAMEKKYGAEWYKRPWWKFEWFK